MITIQELNTVITSLYMSSKLSKVGFSSLSEADKQVLLNEAVEDINNLQLDGYSVDGNNAFPRCIRGEVIEVNDKVRKSIATYVYEILDIESDSIKQAILSGKKSESNDGYSVTYNTDGVNLSKRPRKYRSYLSDYIYRGV